MPYEQCESPVANKLASLSNLPDKEQNAGLKDCIQELDESYLKLKEEIDALKKLLASVPENLARLVKKVDEDSHAPKIMVYDDDRKREALEVQFHFVGSQLWFRLRDKNRNLIVDSLYFKGNL